MTSLIIITGSRDWSSPVQVTRALDRSHAKFGADHGDRVGTYHMIELCQGHNIPVWTVDEGWLQWVKNFAEPYNMESRQWNILMSHVRCMALEKAGKSLAARLNSAIDKSDTPRDELIVSMGKAASISPNTVRQILRGEIECPPLNRLNGFAKVLSVSADSLRSAAEKDGCKYGDG